jgi:hypothetical protein
VVCHGFGFGRTIVAYRIAQLMAQLGVNIFTPNV